MTPEAASNPASRKDGGVQLGWHQRGAWRRWHLSDVSRGVLDSEEHLVWRGLWPNDQACQQVPSLMKAAHVRSIQRFSLGLIRCHVKDTGVDCRLTFGPRVLSFVDESTDYSDGRIVRRWRITPGLLVRAPREESRSGALALSIAPAAPLALGTLTLGIERQQAQQLHAWMRVEAFPSRFLGPVPLPPFDPHSQPAWRVAHASFPRHVLGAAWTGIGWLYGNYHSLAAYSTLAFLAHSLGETA